ncbi:MAG: rod shape-determining protein MreC [Clostridia bacterium]|nr:rod shape-determining protein MreC [Clostridia bacterium]
MRFFFRSRQFKIILLTVIVFIALSVIFALIGSRISPQADIMGTVTAPFRAAFTKISNGVSDFVSTYTAGNEMELKNAELENEINELRRRLADYEQMQAENEFYKDYLEIKDANPDFGFTAATLISRDTTDPYGGFVINRGSLDGIEATDPVITDAGLVGYIAEVGLTTSKVATVLSPDVVLGALDNRTNDSGILSGALQFAEKGQTRLYNLSRSCNIAVGDYIVTSGEGVFPAGLLVGTIKSIGSDQYNTSIYAAVEPFADLEAIRSVMVITEFEGQGGVKPGSGE